MKDAIYEAGRVADVLMFGANECLSDDGQTFSCDITPHGRRRRVHTQREPLLGVITAITPFNHPMNQVAHKVVPAVATNNRMVLKPSEKVPLSALLFADILYEAGLPPPMLSVLTGDPKEIADELLTNPTRRPDHLHRRRGDRQVHRSQGRLPPHRAGAGRQRPDHRDGRRRPRRSLVAGGAGLVQELRPALHRGQAHAGARGGRRTLHRPGGRKDAGLALRRSVGSGGRDGHRDRRSRSAAVRGARRRGGGAGCAPAGGQPARRCAVRADGDRPRRSVDDRGARGDLRPGVADHPLPRRRPRHRDRQRHRLWPVVVGLHQPHGRDHPFRQRTPRRHRQRARGAGLPARADAVRRHQGLGPGLQGGCAGGDEELHQPEDLLAALVTDRRSSRRCFIC